VLRLATLLLVTQLFGAEPAATPPTPPEPLLTSDDRGMYFGELQAAFLYQILTKKVIPLEELAEWFDTVQGEHDEFKKADAVKNTKPLLDQMKKEVEATKRFFIPTIGTLGQYDFKRKGFPTGIGVDLSVTARTPGRPVFPSRLPGPAFIVTFTNASSYSFVQVPEAKAREITALFTKQIGRAVEVEFQFRPVAAGLLQDTFEYRRVKGELLKVRILSASGAHEVLAEL
jgi:hypothetical protein